MAKRKKIGVLQAIFTGDTKSLTMAVRDAQKSVAGYSGRMKRVGKQMQSVGKRMSMGLTLPIVGMGMVIARTAATFEQSMNKVRGLTKDTERDFKGLSDFARELGAATQYSASEAADAMGVLAQSGVNTLKEIKATLPATLNLAAAANIELEEATDRTRTALKQFNLGVDQTARATDVLVKMANSANMSVVDLSDALNEVGTLARSAGYSLENTTSVLAMFHEAGIKGTRAGTALKSILGAVVNPSGEVAKKLKGLGIALTDTAGRALPFDQILKSLAPHVNDAGVQLAIFQKRGGPAMAGALIQGADALEGFQKKAEGAAGAAKAMADVRMKGLAGSLRQLNSAFEEMQLALAETGLLAFLADAAKGLTGVARTLGKTNPEILKWITSIAGIAAIAGPVVWAIGSLVSAIGSIWGVIAGAAGVITAFLGGPITAIVVAIGVLTAVWHKYGDDIKVFVDRAIGYFGGLAERAGAVLKPFTDVIYKELVGRYGGIVKTIGEYTDKVVGYFSKMYDKVAGHSYVPDMLKEIKGEFGSLAKTMVDPTSKATRSVSELFKTMGDKVQSTLEDMASSMMNTLFSDAFSSMLPGIFGRPAAAAATAGGNVQAHARGAVLTRATAVAPGHIAGEAGPEGIFPLARMGSELGVRGAAPVVSVTVNDMRARGEPVQIESTERGDGSVDIEILLRDAMKRNFRAREFDPEMRDIYNIKPRGSRR
ncbi:MAG: phage tail tape measure protein [Candidatus Eisenbacteria sp.]|nr:phage tail tape measure protein [Candidatus Eisenbacteria bacterium]